MTNHANRSRRNPSTGRTPTPCEIRAARLGANLDERDAAIKVYSTERFWRLCELGQKRMHPSMFELFCIKTRQAYLLAGAISTGSFFNGNYVLCGMKE